MVTKNYLVSLRAYAVVAIPAEEVSDLEGDVLFFKLFEMARDQVTEWDDDGECEGEAIELITEDKDGNELSVEMPFERVIPSLQEVPSAKETETVG